METQTLFNVIFALVTLVLFISVVCLMVTRSGSSGGGGDLKSGGPADVRESMAGDDGYQDDLDVLSGGDVETFDPTKPPPSPTVGAAAAAVHRGEENMREDEEEEEERESCSTTTHLLFHHNAANLPIPQFVRLANGYRADLVSGSIVVIDKLRSSETFCANSPVPNAYSSFKDPYVDVAHHQWSSRMSEMWCNNDYVAADKAAFRPVTDAVCYRSDAPHHSRMYVVRLLRVADKVEFYYVHFAQTYKNGYTDDLAYVALVEAVNTLKRFHSDADYVIVGNFNVHGHEAVFRHHLPDHYAVCDFRTVPTAMDARGRGIASPDGLVVSTRVYEAVEYRTELSNLNASNGALVLLAALSVKRQNRAVSGAYLSDRWSLRRMMDDLSGLADEDSSPAPVTDSGGIVNKMKKKKSNRVYYGQRSSFDPSRHRTTALMYASDLRVTSAVNPEAGGDRAAVEVVSSNVLLRKTETPVTAALSVGNGVAVQLSSTTVTSQDRTVKGKQKQKKNTKGGATICEEEGEEDDRAKNKARNGQRQQGPKTADRVVEETTAAVREKRPPTATAVSSSSSSSPYSEVIQDLNEFEKQQRP